MSIFSTVQLMDRYPDLIASLLIGYLFGSIPYGWIWTRIFGLGEISHIGSGNIGATNVLRTQHKLPACLTLICDVMKGAAPVYLGIMFFDTDMAVLAGFGAFLGHLFTPYLKFRGGKGVATYAGILLGFSWRLFLVFCVTWFMTAVTSRIASVASLMAILILLVPVYINSSITSDQFCIFLVMSVLVAIKHKDNLIRLILGTEPKIGEHKNELAKTKTNDSFR